MKDARRDQTQNRLRSVDDKRMAGIMAAIETHDAVGLLREPVDDLALAFVTPLSAHNHNISCHLR